VTLERKRMSGSIVQMTLILVFNEEREEVVQRLEDSGGMEVKVKRAQCRHSIYSNDLLLEFLTAFL